MGHWPAASFELSVTGLVRPGAVVQAGKLLEVRGRCAAGLQVTVDIDSCKSSSMSDQQGHWRCPLGPLPAGGPYHGRITCSDGQSLALDDLYAGEVWLCAGQSNMAMTLSALVPQEQPEGPCETVVRFANIKPAVSGRPKQELAVQWLDANEHVTQVSAVGYHFARELGRRLGVPIGIVQAAVGHTPAMAWTKRERIPSGTHAATMLDRFDQLAAEDPYMLEDLESYSSRLAPQTRRWNQAVAAWQPQARWAMDQNLPLPPMPEFPMGVGSTHTPCVLYNAMLAPLTGETLAGVLWYQGETDAILGLEQTYERSLQGVMGSMLDTVGQLPFVVVEIPRHCDIQCVDPDETWPGVRQAQRIVVLQAARLQAVGLVPTLDLGDTRMIHPTSKKTLSVRAAQIAMAIAYPHNFMNDASWHTAPACHGPLFESASYASDEVVIHFTGVQGRLLLKAVDHTGPHITPAVFEWYSNGQWHGSQPLLIAKDRIMLKTTTRAQGVRYAWACDPLPILFDESHLPVSSFRTWAASGLYEARNGLPGSGLTR